MKLHKTFFLPLIALAFSGIAAAQFVGPSNAKITTVAEVHKSGADNQYVELRGNLLKKVGAERYEFSDGTGAIRVEIDDELFPHEPIDERTKVQIRGEIDKEVMNPIEIDVKSIRRLD